VHYCASECAVGGGHHGSDRAIDNARDGIERDDADADVDVDFFCSHARKRASSPRPAASLALRANAASAARGEHVQGARAPCRHFLAEFFRS